MFGFSIARAFAAPAIVLAFLAAGPATAAPGRAMYDTPSPITTLSEEDLERLPGSVDLAELTRLFQPGQAVAVKGRYSAVRMQTLHARLDPAPLPIGVGTFADGTDVTSFTVPKDTSPGRVVIEFVPLDGVAYSHEGHVYAFLRSWIEQDKLRSFQRANFGFELAFGDGPGKVSLVVTTSGPIRYDKAGQSQTLSIDGGGRATLNDYIQSLRGSPAGTPFSIVPTFSDLQIEY